MSCEFPILKYLPHSEGGLVNAVARKDGKTIALEWFQAWPSSFEYKIAYNIYYSTVREHVFTEGPKYVSINPTNLKLELFDFTPGDTFWFAVRATQYSSQWMDLSLLPNSGDSKVYSEGILLSDLDIHDGYIHVSDVDTFPVYGVIQIGAELIYYSNKDLQNNYLLGLIRGFLDTNIRYHSTSGFDGYHTTDPIVRFWKGMEEQNQVIHQETAEFSYPNYPFTDQDGYKEIKKDILTTDLSSSDAVEANFPRYDFTGWRRTSLSDIIMGRCIGTYIGGERYCADGYSGVGRMIRGISMNDASAQRLEVQLDETGDNCILVKKQKTGIVCKCYQTHQEQPDDRCPICFGTGKVVGYQQFFNPRRSDGRIKVRFSPSEDLVKLDESGFESTFSTEGWTLVYPIIKDRDFIIRLSLDGFEEFRYEVMGVTRNKLFESFSGAQKLRLVRVRKTDPLYNVRVNYDTSIYPKIIQTTIGSVPGAIPPHVHDVHISEKIILPSQINETTSTVFGHNHLIRNGKVIDYLANTKDGPANLSHTHEIIL